MKNKLVTILFFLAIVPLQNIYAQCSMGLPSTPQFVTQAISTIQTFQPTCSGPLKNVVIPSVFSPVQDIRDAFGVMVQCRIKSSTGTLLAAGPMTDQWYPGATNITFDFSCHNLYLVSGTTYQLEFLGIFPTGVPPYWLILFHRSNTSIYAGGHLIVDGIAYPNRDLRGWTVNLDNGSIAATNSTQIQPISPCNGFYNAASELITSVQPGTTNGIAGSTTAKVWIEGSQPTQFVKRHYEITPVSNAASATGRVTLYFTQAEFDAFNAVNAVKLPTGAADATGKANLLIEKRPGISSDGSGLPNTYTGTPVSINPSDADIIWNGSANRWEVSFDVTGFSGFFVKTLSGTLPLQWLSLTGNLNTIKQVVLNFKVNETNVANYIIEKSSDGRNFTSIAIISSKGNGENSYQFTDATALDGIKYYRIKQIDADGRYSHSTIIRLSNDIKGSISIYPNPVKDIVTIGGAISGTKAILTDISGKVLQQINITSTVFSVDMGMYSSGIYLLKTQEGITQKIIKE